MGWLIKWGSRSLPQFSVKHYGISPEEAGTSASYAPQLPVVEAKFQDSTAGRL